MSVNLCGQAVGGRWQISYLWVRSVVLYLVDKLLWMFYSNAQGKGLGLEEPIALGKEFVDVAGRMTCGKDDGNTPILVTLRVFHSAHLAMLYD